MPTVQTLLDALETFSPTRWAFDFDHVGLQVGRREADVKRVLVALDWSHELVDAAIAAEAHAIVVHHPLIWEPLTELSATSLPGAVALRLAEAKIALIAAHTNWDCAPGGVNEALAEALGLIDVAPFGDGVAQPMAKFIAFCPKETVQPALDALSAVGCGRIGAYSRCGFWTDGFGTFVGDASTNPSVGVSENAEIVPESRLEMVVPQRLVRQAIEALICVHPYETPAYDVVPVAPLVEARIGRIGSLPQPMALRDYKSQIERQLQTSALIWGDLERPVRRVAVIGGASDGLWRTALDAGADALVTGEVKQDRAVAASAAGLALISAGHYATEQPGIIAMQRALERAVQGISCSVFEPPVGSSGRPF